MRKTFVLFLLLTSNVLFGQAFPFGITFGKVYIGTYDVTAKRTTAIKPADGIHYVSIDFDGQSQLNAKFFNRGKIVDSVQLSIVQAEQTPLNGIVEYKYVSSEGQIVFMRYNRVGVPGIIEVSIFSPELSNFVYIKNTSNVE